MLPEPHRARDRVRAAPPCNFRRCSRAVLFRCGLMIQAVSKLSERLASPDRKASRRLGSLSSRSMQSLRFDLACVVPKRNVIQCKYHLHNFDGGSIQLQPILSNSLSMPTTRLLHLQYLNTKRRHVRISSLKTRSGWKWSHTLAQWPFLMKVNVTKFDNFCTSRSAYANSLLDSA